MTRTDLAVAAADGEARAALFRPANGPPGRGIVFYMDAFGPRPALYGMADRLAGLGYTVLLPDLFYRSGVAGPFDVKAVLADEKARGQVFGLGRATSQEMTRRDGTAFLDALAAAGASAPFGVVGYCMGGARALTAAAAHPDRIAAAASIHGGNLASDAADSPHLLAGAIKARVYVASAGVDTSFPPEQSARLAEALRRAGVDHMIENYVGASHGWSVPDLPVFDPAAAERHWRRLATFFGETLG